MPVLSCRWGCWIAVLLLLVLGCAGGARAQDAPPQLEPFVPVTLDGRPLFSVRGV